MKKILMTLFVVISAPLAAMATDPWADNVVDYTPGTGLPVTFTGDPMIPGTPFDNDLASLGAPTRDGTFGAISPYSPAGSVNEVVSLGEGGSLTVSFDEPVTNDPLNPFGIDLLIFSNAFIVTNNPVLNEDTEEFEFIFDETTTNSSFLGEVGGIVEISSNGIDFTEVTGAFAEGLYPTNGYADSTTHFPGTGSVLADFLKPVDPSVSLAGLTAAETYAAYDGSGGGTGIDIGAFGFSEISYVRVTNPIGSGVTPEIDAFADVRAVPEPSTLLLMLVALPFAKRRNS